MLIKKVDELRPVAGEFSEKTGPIKKTVDGKYFTRLCLLFIFVCFAGELLATYNFSRGFIHAKSPDFISPEGVLAAVKSERAGKQYILTLGDSVMGYSALEKEGVPNPQAATIPANLKKILLEHVPDATLVNGAMDGSLAGDFQGFICLLREYSLLPSMVIIQIDYRLFADEHDKEDHLSRKWLAPYLSYHLTFKKSEKKVNYATERPIDSFIYRNVLLKSDAYLLMRVGWRQVWDGLLRKLYSQETALGGKKEGANEGMALKLLVLPYYQGKEKFSEGRAIRILGDTVDFLKRKDVPVLLLYTPTNLDYFSQLIDASAYQMNTAAIKKWIHARYGDQGGVRLLLLEGEFPRDAYYDHSHFGPAANQKIAELVFNDLVSFSKKSKDRPDAFQFF